MEDSVSDQTSASIENTAHNAAWFTYIYNQLRELRSTDPSNVEASPNGASTTATNVSSANELSSKGSAQLGLCSYALHQNNNFVQSYLYDITHSARESLQYLHKTVFHFNFLTVIT